MNTVESSVESSSAGFMIPTTVNQVPPMYSWMWRWRTGCRACSPPARRARPSESARCSRPGSGRRPCGADIAFTSCESAASTPIPPVCSAGTYGVRSTFAFDTW